LLNKTPNIAVVILAAGASSRMGIPKQVLKWKNTTLLGHAIETAKALDQKKIVVVLGANFNQIEATLNDDHIEIIKNDDWESGMGKSIATGVCYILKTDINFDAVLVMLADQPLVDQSYFNSMIAQYKVGANQIIATAYKSGKQGVPVLFDQVYFEALSQLNDDKGAKVILHRHVEHVSVVQATHDVSDIDTLEDYERIYKSNH